MRWITVSDDDYTRVVALRRLAYGGADKLDPMSDAMADAFDSESAILVATEATTVVGSLRLTPFVRGANEYEQLVTLPADFPPPETMVLTRVCTHPDARGRGLVYALMEAGYTECRRRGFRYVLGGCTDQLLTLYARVGLVRQPLSYTHARLNRIHEHLLFGDLEAIPTGVAERASPGATQ